MEVEYLTAYVSTGDGISKIDVLKLGPLEHWLVPSWVEWPDEGLQTPERAIRLEGLAFQHGAPGLVDLTVQTVVPKAVLDGETQSAEGLEFQVEEWPTSRFGKLPIPRRN